MKLELKHISPYLPYGLKCKILNSKCDYVGIEESELNGFYLLSGYPHFTYKGGSTGKSFSEFTPYLRPLSKFELSGFEIYIGSEWCEAYGEWFDSFDGNETTKKGLILKAPYPVIQYCLENHIDIYDLLDNNLALPIQD